MDAIFQRLRGRLLRYAAIALTVAGILVIGVGAYRLVAYSVPLANGDYIGAAESGAGDASVALYDAGLQAYREGNLDAAQQLFSASYSKLLADGTLPTAYSKQKLASDCQFYLGNIQAMNKQIEPAIQAYEQSLRLNPDNMDAKYNLEMLKKQQQGGGGSGNGGDQGKPGGPPGKGGKTGI